MPPLTTSAYGPSDSNTQTFASAGAPWSNTSNVQTDDANAATASISSAVQSSDSIEVSDFGITLPLTAYPTQLNFNLKAQRSGMTVARDYEVFTGLLTGAQTNGVDLAAPTNLSTSQMTISYTDDLSGRQWTRQELMSPDFCLTARARFVSGLAATTVSFFYLGDLTVTYESRPLPPRMRLRSSRFTRLTH